MLEPKEIETLLIHKEWSALRGLLRELEPADIAALLAEIPLEQLPVAFRLLPKDLAAEVFVEFDGDDQEHLIRSFTDKELREMLDELFVDDTVDLIEEMPAVVVKRILRQTDAETRKAVNQILNYPKDSAGSMMTIEFVDLKQNMTASEAIARIRAIGVDKETVYSCYVIDPNRHLLGVVSIRALLFAKDDEQVGDIMDTNIISATTLEDREDVALKFAKYSFLALPVVDNENRLVGIITVDDAVEVLQDENTEDFAKMAAMTSASDENYLKTSVWRHARSRIVWLLFLMLSATLTGTIITRYETAFAAVPLLVAFIPMLMDTGGNCGSQSATVVIRGLALKEIEPRNILRVLWKEFRIALMVGLLLAVVNSVRLWLMYRNQTEVSFLPLCILLSITLMVVVILAKALGCLLPIGAKRCGLDPAIMASPLITTIVDTCSVLVFFTLATRMMEWLIP